MRMKHLLLLTVAIALASCGGDPNSKPTYGKGLGLPSNCRAYVQTVIDGYRSRQYSAEDSFAGLERNCGAYGQLWGN